MPEWGTIGQAGFWGPDRKRKEAELNSSYGPGNWRVVHVLGKNGEQVIPWLAAVELYGYAYYEFLKKNDAIRDYLRKNAKDVYVYNEQAVVRGEQNLPETLDYTVQEIEATHLQDISIRRAFLNLGIWFEGERLICVRGGSDDEIGRRLSPGIVPFHLPEKIYLPHYTDNWIQDGSVACYYHSNKLLQARI